MTTLREAAQQALEALLTYEQYIQPLTNYFGGPRVPEEGSASAKVDAAITALRAALAEPVGLVTHTLNCVCGAVWDIKTDGSEEMAHTPNTAPAHRKPLTHPQIHELDWPDGVSFEEILLFVRSIEAAHGIKEDKP